jgi:hypothetical protein
MATRLSTTARNAATNAVLALLNAGSGAGVIEVRTGSQPAAATDTATGTLLCTVTLADPAFGNSATGTGTLLGVPLSGTGVANGTAGWARAKDSDGNVVLDGSVTATGGGGQIELATTTISTGLTVQLTSLTVSTPSG